MTRMQKGIRKLDNEELKEVTAENAVSANDTTMTDTSNLTSLRSEVFKDRVLQYAEPMRVLQQYARENRDLVNSGDYKIHIPYTDSHLSISNTSSEGAARNYTEMDNLNTKTISVTASDFLKGGIAISKEAVLTSNVDLVKQARYSIAQDLVDQVDQSIKTTIENNAGTTVTSSGSLTPDAINEAMKAIEANDYLPQVLFITPSQQYELRGDSQFTNAAEYGSDEVIQNGEIGSYLGVKVLTSTNISSNTALMLGTTRSNEKVGPVTVWKEEPHIDYEYNKEQAEHRIFYDQAFTTSYLRSGAMVKIDTS